MLRPGLCLKRTISYDVLSYAIIYGQSNRCINTAIIKCIFRVLNGKRSVLFIFLPHVTTVNVYNIEKRSYTVKIIYIEGKYIYFPPTAYSWQQIIPSTSGSLLGSVRV